MVDREPRIVYPPVDRCIYCGRDDVPLFLEHILALAFGGNFELPRASCEECAKITGTLLEQIVASKMLGAYRIRANLPSRNRRNRPVELPLLVRSRDGDIDRCVVIPVKDHPSSFVLPQFDEPRLISQKSADQFGFRVWGHLPGGVGSILDQQRRTNSSAINVGTIYPEVFARVLAKIAHSIAAAELGYPIGSHQLLPDIVLSDRTDPNLLVDGSISMYVGGIADEFPPENQIPHRIILRRETIKDKEYHVALIRLFAYLGTPVYHVIIAET